MNSNFSYAVLAQHRDQWLNDIKSACVKAGGDITVCQHKRDDATLDDFHCSKRPLYDFLDEYDVFVSRFSEAILEALVKGKNVIYHNPGFEEVDKFMDPLGVNHFAKNKDDLVQSLGFFTEGGKLDSSRFLHRHRDLSAPADGLVQSSISKTTQTS